MADQGSWFKLWIGADDDPDLGNLSLNDFARWCKFGLYLKKYGTGGQIELKAPCLPLQNKFQVSSFEAVLDVLRTFPNCNVTGVTKATVTWTNWQKYQGDNSAARVRRFRSAVTVQKRREEKRAEENRREEDPAALAPPAGAAKAAKPEAKKSSLDPRIKAVADKIYGLNPAKFSRLITWIRQAQKSHFGTDEIVKALTDFAPYSENVEDWWPYLDTLIYKAAKNLAVGEHDHRHGEQKLAARNDGAALKMIGLGGLVRNA